MGPRFRAALAGGIALGIAAAFYVIWVAQPDDGLPVGDLLRVESVDDPVTISEDHIRWSFEVFGGERQVTEQDLADRFAPSFAAGFTAPQLNAQIDTLNATYGPISFVRYDDSAQDLYRAVGVADIGVPLQLRIRVAEDGRIAVWGLDELPSPPRLPGWQSTLILVGGWLLLAAGAAAARLRDPRRAWTLVGTAVVVLSAVLILASSAFAYTAGRVLPALFIALAVSLLLGQQSDQLRRRALIGASIAAVLAFLAPSLRDPALIGHPDVVALLTDNEVLYKGILSLSALAAGSALSMAAVSSIRQVHRASRWRHAPLWATVFLAGGWALAEIGAAIAFAIGNGSWAAGPFTIGALAALVALPILIGFRLVTFRWDRPELASLVIDLESGGGDLQPAVARALEDPTVRVLTSSNGEQLVDREGAIITGEELPAGRTLTQIRSGGHLVGALDHDAVLLQHGDRLNAVVAAVGLALEVGRLNDQVTAQLGEVRASRARIIDAADHARRRLERNLHDGAQQRLVALGLELQRLRLMAESAGDGQLAEELEAATAEVRGTIEDIRSVSRGTQPAILTERGLGAAIDVLIERSAIPVQASVEADDIPSDIETTTFYVVAEALTNVAKHSGATQASVSVTKHNGAVYVAVSDNGGGGAVITSGSGLEGLDDRVAAAGGSFGIRSSSEGTTLDAVIPCE